MNDTLCIIIVSVILIVSVTRVVLGVGSLVLYPGLWV